VPRQGGTALAVAAKLGTLDQIRWLLERGADHYISTGQGITAGVYASTGRHTAWYPQVLELFNEFKRHQ
jgi:ankyrin repeat protein